MKVKSAVFGLFITALYAGTVTAISQMPEVSMPGNPAQQGETIPTSDTILPPTPQALADSAFANYMKLQYGGAPESEVYPAVIAAYDAVVNAVCDTLDNPTRSRMRAILLDIYNPLKKGAFHYSGISNQAEMTRFAKAYVDAPLTPVFGGDMFHRDVNVYPSLTYICAQAAYNGGDLEEAKKYLELYLATDEKKMREQVMVFLAQACINTKDYGRGLKALVPGVAEFPMNYQMLQLAMKLSIDGGYPDKLKPLLDRALMMKPDDESLMNIQAQVYESEQSYQKALDIYRRLAETHPNSKTNTEHLASCYYNLGTLYYNESIIASDEKEAKKNRRQSRAYFSSAAENLETILSNTPGDMKYLRALGIAYGCLDEKEKFAEINQRIQALGGTPLAINAMPAFMGESFFGKDEHSPSGSGTYAIPSYADFAKSYIENNMSAWSAKGEFEPIEEYRARMAGGAAVQEFTRLKENSKKEYLDKFSHQLLIQDLKLEPYDVDNQTYLIQTDFGPLVLPVPLENQEAEAFKAGWDNVNIREPKFEIIDDKVAISSLTFQIPGGRTYTYKADISPDYDPNSGVVVDLQAIIDHATGNAEKDKFPTNPKPTNGPVAVITAQSDVDIDIPQTNRKANDTFALIIANENYTNVAPVESALNDGTILREYLTKTVGVPESQVVIATNATGNQIISSLGTIKNRIKAAGRPVDLIFYYAGHGLPDEKTKSAYLLPSDCDPQHTRTLIPLSEIFGELESTGAENIISFMDACFSGATRSAGTEMVKKERGVKIASGKTEIRGNSFSISAASGDQTALPYREKNHGLFTYFLLKKIRDTKGNVTLQDLADYISKEVYANSLNINNHEQTPVITTSGALSTGLNKKKLGR